MKIYRKSWKMAYEVLKQKGVDVNLMRTKKRTENEEKRGRTRTEGGEAAPAKTPEERFQRQLCTIKVNDSEMRNGRAEEKDKSEGQKESKNGQVT